MQDIFICSYCEQRIKLKPEQIGRVINCPKCNRVVWLFPNVLGSIASQISSDWLYLKDRLLRKPEETGPITDEEFLQLIESGLIAPETSVKSPTMTSDQWVLAGRVKRDLIRAQVSQRAAELLRLRRVGERKAQAEIDNREKLIRAVEQAVSDGRVSLNEREKLLSFAQATGISESEVASLLKEESEKLFQRVLGDCLSDGLLEPAEKARISALALSLGVNLSFTPEQKEQLELADFAWCISNDCVTPEDQSNIAQLNKGEQLIAVTKAEWTEVVASKSPTGIALGNGHYLKSSVEGECVLTNKRIMVIGGLASKKMNLTSIESMQWYSDGLFCNRSTGKSVFLRPAKRSSRWNRFAMVAQHVRSGDPVLGIIPKNSFIPQLIEATIVSPGDFEALDRSASGSKYTFRVVGDFVHDRQYRASRLQIGEPVLLVREPCNEHDPNAVSVRDSQGGDLGYLKREVASWFCKMLDARKQMQFRVAGWTSGGSLLVDVFELR